MTFFPVVEKNRTLKNSQINKSYSIIEANFINFYEKLAWPEGAMPAFAFASR